MRRALLALAVAAGLAIGTVVPVSALGESSITLNCSDGTSVPLLVDTDTLNSLTASVQAMALNPAGLSCSIVQNVVRSFGSIALAGAGQNPFIVAGGRWQVLTTCEELGAGAEPVPAGPAPVPAFIGGGTQARVPGSWSYGPSAVGTPTTIFVNIAVNAHQKDINDPTSVYGTLNETIPTQSGSPPCPKTITERHFTSTPTCLDTSVTGTSKNAAVTSNVKEITPPGATFPGVTVGNDIHFTFTDNGNPPQPTDKLQGPPGPENTASCAVVTTGLSDLVNGNISVRNAS